MSKKTLRELCEEVVAVERDVSRPKWELKRAWDKLHDATDEASQILDALDVEREAGRREALGEVRAAEATVAMLSDEIPVAQVEMSGSRFPHLRVEMPRDVYARYKRAARRMHEVSHVLMDYHEKRASADECMSRIDIVFGDG